MSVNFLPLKGLPDLWISEYHKRSEHLREYRELQKFRRFYNRLEDKQQIFYLFFTGNMLHWVNKCLSFVPEDVNLVLVGSALSTEELQWIQNRTDKPFHLISKLIDDKSFWRFLFNVNKHHFGWLDVDCFVMNPDLFAEMTQMPDQNSFNVIWSYTGYSDLTLLNTFFLYVNADVVEQVRKMKLGVGPTTCSLHLTSAGRHAPNTYSRVLTGKQQKMMKKVWPCDDEGNLTHHYNKYWDTLILYQLAAQVAGYPIRKVRNLWGIAPEPNSYSSEIIHIGSASHLVRATRKTVWGYMYNLHLQFRYALLGECIDQLPSHYGNMMNEMIQEIDELKLDKDNSRGRVRNFLKSMGYKNAILNMPQWGFLH